MATIENVNDRTILQQFHSLYERQNKTETDVQNIDAKIDQETINRQTADLSINTEIQTLKDQIDSLGVLFTYKGEVATIQDLPATDNKPGDVYYVDNEQSEYIWIEKSGVYQWEQFGPAIDLSEYAKQQDLQQLKSEVDAMNTQVENNSSNIVSLTNTKQDKLTAGTNITIDENNVISASGGSGGNVKYYKHQLKLRIIDGNELPSLSIPFVLYIVNNNNTTFDKNSLTTYLYSNFPNVKMTVLPENACRNNKIYNIEGITLISVTTWVLSKKISTYTTDASNITITQDTLSANIDVSNITLLSDTVIEI